MMSPIFVDYSYFILLHKMLLSLLLVFVLPCHQWCLVSGIKAPAAFLLPSRSQSVLHPSSTRLFQLRLNDALASTKSKKSRVPSTLPSWNNTFAEKEIEDLEAFLDSATLGIGRGHRMELKYDTNHLEIPAQTITDKHNHVIFRPRICQRLDEDQDLKSSIPRHQQQTTALVFLPGCFLEPLHYESLALAIQAQSKHPVWIVVPKLFLNSATPWTVPRAVKEAIASLQSLGYPSEKKVFIGGHSLGGTFLPAILKELGQFSGIAGKIQLGSFVVRAHRENNDAAYRSMPRLTVAGDLDGLIRASRISEDIQHHVLDPINAGQDADQTRLTHSVVLIPGMVRDIVMYFHFNCFAAVGGSSCL